MKVIHSSIFRAVCAIIVGVLLIQYREQTVTWITIAIGVLFFLSGVISLASYWAAKRNAEKMQGQILSDSNGKPIMGMMPKFPLVSVGSLILGLLLALMPQVFIAWLMFILAFILILGALTQFVNLASAAKMGRVGILFWLFPSALLLLGLLAIIAAITYTVGTRPYGYIGLGDISVLVFFGWLSVMGSWYLQAHTVIPALFLPATACGLLATAVLNINNLRDIDSDRENGKNTLAVRLGPVNARRYHACLLMGALVCLALFNLISLHSLWGWLFVLAAPLLIKQARFVMRERSPAAMPPMLERTVKGALLTNLLFVIGIVLSQTLS